MSLLIRVDANDTVGAGHAMRTVALAQAWRDSGQVVTVAYETLNPGAEACFKKSGAQLSAITAQAGSIDDARQTASLAKELQAAWVVIDGYQFDSAYQRDLKTYGLRLLWIDDEAHAAPYSADAVLNQNFHANEQMYNARESTTRLFLGPQYTLVREDFSPWARYRRERNGVAENLLVTIGAGNYSGMRKTVLEALNTCGEEFKAIRLIGRGIGCPVGFVRQHLDRLAEKIEIFEQVDDVPKQMAWADVAISAAGCTSLELALMGVPSVLVSVAKNQIAIGEALEKHGAARSLAGQKQLSSRQLADEVQALFGDSRRRAHMSYCAQRLIDGQGAHRVVNALAA